MADIDVAEFKDITTGCPSDSGVFDQLMRSVKAHLKEEYDSSRIRGAEYSQVYIASIQGAMSQAIQWQLSAQQAANQAKLIEAQIEGQEKQNALLDKQSLLLDEQIQQIIAQTALTVQQTALAVEQTNIAAEDVKRTIAQTTVLEATLV